MNGEHSVPESTSAIQAKVHDSPVADWCAANRSVAGLHPLRLPQDDLFQRQPVITLAQQELGWERPFPHAARALSARTRRFPPAASRLRPALKPAPGAGR